MEITSIGANTSGVSPARLNLTALASLPLQASVADADSLEGAVKVAEANIRLAYRKVSVTSLLLDEAKTPEERHLALLLWGMAIDARDYAEEALRRIEASK